MEEVSLECITLISRKNCLTAEQKQKSLYIATCGKKIFDVETEAFLRRIVAIAETWIRDFQPELKSQPNEWGELQIPLGQKNFGELNQRSSK